MVDTSALMAILLREPGWRAYATALGEAEEVLISAGTLIEAYIVAEWRGGVALSDQLDALVEEVSLRVWPLQQADASLARRAWRRFGKGIHPAGLNLGDCFAYALATKLDCPLLFKGDDFAQTDVKAAI